VRQASHLFAEDTLRLSWISCTASLSDFHASGERFLLHAFNAHQHLDGDLLLTYWQLMKGTLESPRASLRDHYAVETACGPIALLLNGNSVALALLRQGRSVAGVIPG
jgi:hypothetical protein